MTNLFGKYSPNTEPTLSRITEPTLPHIGASARSRAKARASTPAGRNLPRNGVSYQILSYQRVSKDDEKTGSHTFETQTRRIEQKLDQVYGPGCYEITEFCDNGLSGAYGLTATGVETRTRKELKNVIAALETGEFDCLIVYSLSRLVRSPRWFYQLMEDYLLPSGIDFFSATEDINIRDPQQRAAAGVMALIDGSLREGAVKRCKDAAQTRAEAGYVVGQVGYGWQWEPRADMDERGRSRQRRRIVRDEKQGQWVRYIVDRYLEGWGTVRIAGDLNQRQVPSASGTRPWTFAGVLSVLNSPVHAGFVPWEDKLIKGEHHDLCYYDIAVFEQIQAAKHRRTPLRTNRRTQEIHVLSSLAFCARCGRRLYITSAAGWVGYHCTTGLPEGQATCRGVRVKAELLEQAVVHQLEQVATMPQMQALLQAEAATLATQDDERLKTDCTTWQEKIRRIKGQSVRWADGFSQGIVSAEQFAEYNNPLQKDLAEAETKLATTERALVQRTQREAFAARLQATLRDFPAIWAELDLEERREVLALLIEKLTVDRAGRELTLTLKLALLPEQTIVVPLPNVYHHRAPKEGVEALTSRQLVLLYHLSQGKTMLETATEMGVNLGFTQALRGQVRKRLGIKDMMSAAAMARRRINTLLPTLRLGALPGQAAAGSLVLTPILAEVLPLLAGGATNQEVSQTTGLSVPAVAGRRGRLLRLFGTRSIFEAAQKAKEAGVFPA